MYQVLMQIGKKGNIVINDVEKARLDESYYGLCLTCSIYYDIFKTFDEATEFHALISNTDNELRNTRLDNHMSVMNQEIYKLFILDMEGNVLINLSDL